MAHGTEDLELLRPVSGDRGLRAYLDKERAAALKVLESAIEPVQMFRAQAKFTFVNRLIQALDESKNLR